MTAQSCYISPTGPGTWPYQPFPSIRPYTPPYVPPTTIPYTPPVTTQFISQDYILTKVKAIVEMLSAKAITRAEARKMLAKVDPAFAAILG